MIRVIHVIDEAPEGLAEEVRAVRELPGIAQAELYRSLGVNAGERESVAAVAILAESEAAYSALIDALSAYPALRHVVVAGRTEAYTQAPYELIDGKWTPVSRESSCISWPADSEISIVIQGAYAPNPEMRALTAAEIAETRREPGCVFYAWMENVELDNHLMLLEVWADQQIYDAHWFGRLATADYRGDSGRQPAPPLRGTPSREFYRRQEFAYHYGRILPARIDHYTQTIVWSPR